MIAGRDAARHGEAKEQLAYRNSRMDFREPLPGNPGCAAIPMTDFPLIRVFRRASVTSPSPAGTAVPPITSTLRIRIMWKKGVAYLEVDGKHVNGNVVPVEDGKTEYHVTVHLE